MVFLSKLWNAPSRLSSLYQLTTSSCSYFHIKIFILQPSGYD